MVVLGRPSIVRIMTYSRQPREVAAVLTRRPHGPEYHPAPVVEEADGGGTYPGYHTRKVAASDHLPRGDMTGTVFLTG